MGNLSDLNVILSRSELLNIIDNVNIKTVISLIDTNVYDSEEAYKDLINEIDFQIFEKLDQYVLKFSEFETVNDYDESSKIFEILEFGLMNNTNTKFEKVNFYLNKEQIFEIALLKFYSYVS